MIEFKNISVTYPGGVEALKNITLDITEGDFVIITKGDLMGTSGSTNALKIVEVGNLVEV